MHEFPAAQVRKLHLLTGKRINAPYLYLITLSSVQVTFREHVLGHDKFPRRSYDRGMMGNRLTLSPFTFWYRPKLILGCIADVLHIDGPPRVLIICHCLGNRQEWHTLTFLSKEHKMLWLYNIMSLNLAGQFRPESSNRAGMSKRRSPGQLRPMHCFYIASACR